MKIKVINTIGLTLGIIGVVLIFIWGPPQPQLDTGISLGLEDATPIDSSGKTVAEHNEEVLKLKKLHEVLSGLGLIFIMIGFGFQIWGTWCSEGIVDKSAPPNGKKNKNLVRLKRE